MSIEPLPSPRRGLPTWVLSAVLPLMLSLGFVAGMGLAHVRLLQTPQLPTPNPSSQPEPAKGEAANTPSSSNPTPPLNSGTLNPARLQPAPAGSDKPSPDPSVIPPVTAGNGQTPPATGPSTGDQRPGDVYGDSPVASIRTIQEARLALVNDQAGRGPIPQIDYQQMRNASGTVSLVGILNAEQYMTWEAVLRREPESLQDWLQAAANLVLNPAQTDQFALNWALVETRLSPPSWALPSEVTALEDGKYLIVRYLAGTSPGQARVDLRPLSSLGSQADSTAAWSRYGPQIRFDSTDIYRPSGVSGTEPKKP